MPADNLSPNDPSIPKDPTIPLKANFEAFEVKIYNQVGLVFQGEVKALASTNKVGDFSLLPGHANFISLIIKPIVVFLKNGEIKKFDVNLGVLRCLHNNVEVYTGLLVDKQTEALARGLQASPETQSGLDESLKVDEVQANGLWNRLRRPNQT